MQSAEKGKGGHKNKTDTHKAFLQHITKNYWFFKNSIHRKYKLFSRSNKSYSTFSNSSYYLLIYDFVAALFFKHITLSWMTSHVKVAPGHIIGSEIRKQDGITMSNYLNVGVGGGGRSRVFRPLDSRSGREVLVRVSLSHLMDLCGCAELNSPSN